MELYGVVLGIAYHSEPRRLRSACQVPSEGKRALQYRTVLPHSLTLIHLTTSNRYGILGLEMTQSG